MFIPLLRLLIIFVLIQPLRAQEFLSAARQDVDTLTCSDMMGRSYQRDGHEKAAEYIRSVFSQLDLQPLGDDYFQEFDLELNVITEEPRLVLDGKPLKPGREFLPFASSAEGQAEQETRIIHVGAGLYLPDKKINEFAVVDSRDAILVMDETVPEDIRKDKSIDRRAYSRGTRIAIARQLQAAAVIFLVDNLTGSSPGQKQDMVILDILKRAWPPKVQSIDYRVSTDFESFDAWNVAALLPGTAVPDSNIILCAHYDHLGALGDSIYFPGANDNASGTAMLLSLARYFARHPQKYSLLFLAFSGEEAGLIGSRYYAENPLTDLRKSLFLINFDMVASGEEGVMAVGGVDYPAYFEQLRAVNDSLRLGKLAKRKNAPNGDHYFLTRKGVKGFYLYTNKGKQPYHHVNDLPATLEWDDFRHIYELAKNFIIKLNK